MAPPKTRPHKPMLAEWTIDILSLSLSLSASLACVDGYLFMFVPFAEWLCTMSNGVLSDAG